MWMGAASHNTCRQTFLWVSESQNTAADHITDWLVSATVLSVPTQRDPDQSVRGCVSFSGKACRTCAAWASPCSCDGRRKSSLCASAVGVRNGFCFPAFLILSSRLPSAVLTCYRAHDAFLSFQIFRNMSILREHIAFRLGKDDPDYPVMWSHQFLRDCVSKFGDWESEVQVNPCWEPIF
jgi:hypothetical protein